MSVSLMMPHIIVHTSNQAGGVSLHAKTSIKDKVCVEQLETESPFLQSDES
jgi:hypothetical protein